MSVCTGTSGLEVLEFFGADFCHRQASSVLAWGGLGFKVLEVDAGVRGHGTKGFGQVSAFVTELLGVCLGSG